MQEFPEVNEIVVVRVKKVLGYGAFAELLEYSDIKGFIHISQVTSGWVKNVRNFVKENQLRAAQVLSIDRNQGQIDLSLNKVSSGVQRRKIEEYNRLVRSKKLIEVLAKNRKVSFDEAWENTAELLLEEFDSLPEAFNAISVSGKIPSSIKSPWSNELLELVKKNVVVPTKTVKGVIEITSFQSNGIELIKEALNSAGKDSDIIYAGSGKYQIKVVSADYKSADKKLSDSIEKIEKVIARTKGKFEFKKTDKE
ncbi:S1 RNA-binding domain-containing protein [Candidatus Micrarchaeota archaeon]|nr:S1 RNA-binding domain-containing protein [Candidatus Micrarchaeota archaeon]